jgi:hypothetical protein
MAQMGPGGALLVGGVEELAEKIIRHNVDLGGIARLTFQLDTAGLEHEKLMDTISLIGDQLKPLLADI